MKMGMLLEGEAEERREEAGLVWAGPEGWGKSRRMARSREGFQVWAAR